MAIATALTACNTPQKDTDIIGKNNLKIENGRMTPEALWALGRLGDVQVSPDGTQLLYGVTYYSVAKNKSNREIFVINTDGSNARQITHSAKSEYAAKWVKNGTRIAFLSAESGSVQLWEMNPDGTKRKQITNHEGGISDFMYSPDGKKILFIADVKYGERTIDKHPDLDKATGRLINELMYRHWDEWVETIPHPFLVDYDGKKVTNKRDILAGEPYECPMKPFGGIEQITFSPDSKTIAYTCRKKTGKAYAESTNSDIYLYDIATDKTIKNLTESMMGYDINPVFSPDGTKLAWESMENDGNESDKNRLFVLDLTTGIKSDISEKWDQSCATLCWDTTGNSIYLTSCQHGTTQIYKADIATKTFTQITSGQHDYEAIALIPNGLVGVRHSMSAPNDIYAISFDGTEKQLTYENKHLLDQMKMGRVEERWMTTTDNKKMLVWIIYPPKFDTNKKYPTLLYCQGGPQSPVSQFWSYRWNFQIMAANDYIIVAPNRRGLYGFGNDWLEQISGDYSGQCMKDYFTAIDTFCKEPFVDSDRLGCVGASFGGFSVYWLAGHHNKRFKAFIAHDGMFNLEQQYLETEEMWFVNRDFGGPYWEKDNAIAQKSYASSPHLFVDKWDTPILCIHGEKDFRIVASQTMAAFNAAKLRGIPAQLLIFPDENHWVLQPQNGILWQRTFFAWLDKWLKTK
ncbi:MAG TPA: S9 family peptidase [Paludibacteraceae bacterium]|nr:S9 family peptidase [Paludibacteraceae bacterium]HRU72668.1 S9 family peptidase [Paludibacteraceae bacterium]